MYGEQQSKLLYLAHPHACMHACVSKECVLLLPMDQVQVMNWYVSWLSWAYQPNEFTKLGLGTLTECDSSDPVLMTPAFRSSLSFRMLKPMFILCF